MKREAALLNIVCIIAALVFVALAVFNALSSPSFLTTDNLFVTMVCMLMALMFAVNPLLYLKDEGRLPIPFQEAQGVEGTSRRSRSACASSIRALARCQRSRGSSRREIHGCQYEAKAAVALPGLPFAGLIPP